MEKNYILIVILALIVLGGGMGSWYYYQRTNDTNVFQPLEKPATPTTSPNKKRPSPPSSTSSIPIQAQYENKIVYTTEQEVDAAALKQDCQEREGEFQECGSVCGPQASTCATICAYTCQLGSSTKSQLPGKWQTYTNKKSSFSIDYSSVLKIEEGDQEIVKFTLLGPTQREGTEIFDGISIIITTATHTQENLKDYINSRLKKTGEIKKVTQKPKRIVLNGNNGYRYETATMGSSTVLTFPLSEKKIIKISYSASDPKDRGYQEIAREVVTSFQITKDQDKAEVNLYYVGADNSCDATATTPVARTMKNSDNLIRDAIELLLKGDLTAKEQEQGISTEFSEANNFQLQGADLKNGTLTLEFSDPNNFTSGGSCRVNLLQDQIKQTALQFFEVQKVKIQPHTLFQP